VNTENERIKLRATFYNNLAVGAAVTGLLVPYVAIWARFVRASPSAELTELISPDAVLSMIGALLLTILFRMRSDAWIRSLEED
jgi:hypothetical protein